MTCAVWLLLSRSLFRVLAGLALIAQVANIIVFSSAGLGDGGHAVIPGKENRLAEGHPDPLAQALVLTAIVISFGTLAFSLVLLKRNRLSSVDDTTQALAQTEDVHR